MNSGFSFSALKLAHETSEMRIEFLCQKIFCGVDSCITSIGMVSIRWIRWLCLWKTLRDLFVSAHDFVKWNVDVTKGHDVIQFERQKCRLILCDPNKNNRGFLKLPSEASEALLCENKKKPVKNVSPSEHWALDLWFQVQHSSFWTFACKTYR